MKKIGFSGLIVILLVVVAAVARIVNAQLHLPNYAPLIALSVFAGAVVKDKKWLAFLVPVFGQLLADVYFSLFTNIPGFYSISGMVFNYGALVAATWIGSRIVLKPMNALFATFGGTVLFFIISNFGFFLEGWNTYSVSGLIKTYVDGIPFFKYTFEGNMICGVAVFSAWFLLHKARAGATQNA